MAPRRVLVLIQVGVASLRCRQKRKIRNTRTGIPSSAKKCADIEPYSLRAANALRLALRAMLRRKAQRSRSNLRSPRWKASFPTRLRLVICAAALRRRADDNPFFSAKKKNPRYPKGYRGFLAEKKGFEPSRRLPDLHP